MSIFDVLVMLYKVREESLGYQFCRRPPDSDSRIRFGGSDGSTRLVLTSEYVQAAPTGVTSSYHRP